MSAPEEPPLVGLTTDQTAMTVKAALAAIQVNGAAALGRPMEIGEVLGLLAVAVCGWSQVCEAHGCQRADVLREFDAEVRRCLEATDAARAMLAESQAMDARATAPGGRA